MARTRASKPATGKQKDEVVSTKPTLKKLDAPVESPPQVFILPKDASSGARIATLANPATLSPNRYFVCPEKGFYEFTRIAAPKAQKRSWLLAPDRSVHAEDDSSKDDGYVLQQPDMFVATPIDPLFLLLPALGGEETGGQEFLATSDFIAKLSESSPHLQSLVRSSDSDKLERIFENRIEAVSDCMDMGDEKMYALSLPKLVKELVSKAKRMSTRGLPASMEDRFVKQALDVPELSMKREESGVSLVKEDSTAGAESQSSSGLESQESATSSTTSTSVETAATSVSSTSTNPGTSAFADLLRVRVALNFILTSYVLPKIKKRIDPLLEDAKTTGIDFSPLDKQLAHIAQLKKDAQALRSLSDNISRKRAHEVDEEAGEKAAEKRRKQEEDEKKKKNVSHGVKKLAKADTSGMKKMSSFFTKVPAKKK
ncbi:hypothetical protein CB0940_06037 [Cercospora beticola]|uniref:Ribonuclease H2 subunit B n=1 Tax=Cercospora beticola TaxID=122368 RepID=A0A2G5HZH2_CERBT|nr:hypothetical protein CB0940_06037 [Cercospora beticola]PIA97936.1 hypothetical protein CB0940_06037 [Cercospora beticola]WPA98649.1 hypothetical protein RHO25_003262 [Cercospora beticola]